jgi:hypothetical protein
VLHVFVVHLLAPGAPGITTASVRRYVMTGPRAYAMDSIASPHQIRSRNALPPIPMLRKREIHGHIRSRSSDPNRNS